MKNLCEQFQLTIYEKQMLTKNTYFSTEQWKFINDLGRAAKCFFVQVVS